MAFTEEEERILKSIAGGFMAAQRGVAAPAPPPRQAPPVDGGRGYNTRGNSRGGGKMRFGRASGTAFVDATDRDLEWYSSAIEKSITDPAKQEYRESNERDLATIREERARRAGAPPAAKSVHDRDTGEIRDEGFDDYGPPAGGDDQLPFATTHDMPPRHIRRWARWAKF